VRRDPTRDRRPPPTRPRGETSEASRDHRRCHELAAATTTRAMSSTPPSHRLDLTARPLRSLPLPQARRQPHTRPRRRTCHRRARAARPSPRSPRHRLDLAARPSGETSETSCDRRRCHELAAGHHD